MNQIIVTVGPSSIGEKCLLALRKAGADVFRINLSHSNKMLLEEYVTSLLKLKLPISIDTQGPQLRVESFNLSDCDDSVSEIFLFFKKNDKSDIIFKNYILLNHPEAFHQIKIGDYLRIDFGGMVVRCDSIYADYIFKIKIVSYGPILLNRAVDVIGKSLELDILTTFDKYAIKYAYKRGCRKVFASFVSSSFEANEIRSYLPNNCKLVSKIETFKGIKNIDKIIDVSDEILIDRGDLSRETSVSMVPLATTFIIERCVKKSIPIHVATNVLDSMMNNVIPSRAEVSDIYNLLDASVNGIVLAAEVAIGNNPIKSVALLKYLMSIYENYNYDFLNTLKKEKPSKELIGEELFNWI